jgi:membrane-bound lytic murein transglycosylase D
MLRALAASIAALSICSSSWASGGELLPRPPALEPNVRFWTRIYSEIDGQGGLIHDSRQLDVVYEVVRLPGGLSRRARERRVEKIKARYRSILRRLAQGKRSGLSEEDARVLGLWPEGVSNSRLRRAARNVRFQLGQADKFRAGLIREGAWRDHIQRVLLEHGVPSELSALPHVESSYNPRAYSRVGAAGLWQFTRSTGRRYLRVDHVVDERMDPFKATVAAARLLRDNYQHLQSWPLAITAYNHGVAGMRRAVRKLHTTDIAEIVTRYESRTFGFASRNFYAEFLAACDVDGATERFFGPLHPDSPQEAEWLTVDHFYPLASLERALGIGAATLREYNPSLRPSVWNGAKYVPRGFELRVPKGSLSAPAEDLLAVIPARERMAKQHRDRFHTVRRGETLSKIAGRYGVRQRELVALNNLRSRHRIRAGQVLRLPDRTGWRPLVVARADPPADGIYRVRRGDTLSIIARRFDIAEAKIVALNDLPDRNRIAVGQRLRVVEERPTVLAAVATDVVPGVVAKSAEAEATPGPETRPAETTPNPEADPAAAAPDPEPDPELVSAAAPEPDEQSADVAREPDQQPDSVSLAADDPPAKAAVSEKPLPTPEAVVAALDAAALPSTDPSNYAVTPDHRITVQAEETLGHYAEWLEIRASRLRRLNRMRVATPVVIGRQAKLDFSRVTPETFVNRRLEYHRTLQEEFFDAYQVTSTETHILRNGDSLWYLARRKFDVPVWLLRQYNPDLDFGSLAPGDHMIIPQIEPRRS